MSYHRCDVPEHKDPLQGQSQMSLNDQLESLYVLANRWGYYDAADFIRGSLGEFRTSYTASIRSNHPRENDR